MNKPVSYLQTDPRWANISYSAKGESTTIGRAGCGPSSMAMVLATWADKSVTPATECAWALKNGYKAPYQGTYYSYFVPAAKRYGLTCTRVNTTRIYGNANSVHHTTARKAVEAGDLVIACMGKGLWTSSGHYVLVYGIEGNMIYINDPASTKMARTHGNYLVFKQQVKYYWIIRKPTTVNEEDEYPMTKKEAENYIKSEVAEQLGILKEEAPKETVYNSEAEIPAWYLHAYEKIAPVLQGTGEGLGLSEELLRVFTILDRLGILPE